MDEKINSLNTNPQRRLPSWLTTVTPSSKALAMILFILFPIIGFYIGMHYNTTQQSAKNVNLNVSAKPTPYLTQNTRDKMDTTPCLLSGLKEFSNNLFELKYPCYWEKDTLDKAYLINFSFLPEDGDLKNFTIDSFDDNPTSLNNYFKAGNEKTEFKSQNGYNFELVTFTGSDIQELFISDGKHIVGITTSMTSLYRNDDENKILDSFRIKGNLSDNWKTHSFPNYGISVKTPENITATENNNAINIGNVYTISKNITDFSNIKNCQINSNSFVTSNYCIFKTSNLTVDRHDFKYYSLNYKDRYSNKVIYLSTNPEIKFDSITAGGPVDQPIPGFSFIAFINTVKFLK